MKLWSIWDHARYRYFDEHGYLVSTWSGVDPDHEPTYRWISQFVPHRSIDGMEPRTAGRPPVWAWAAYDGSRRRRPDLTDSWHLPSGALGYCVELCIDDDVVLLSQFNMWVEALNNGYVVENDHEYDRLARASVGLSHSEEQRSKEQTWARMFDLAFGSHEYWGPLPERQIQACVQCIVTADVVDVERFTAV